MLFRHWRTLLAVAVVASALAVVAWVATSGPADRRAMVSIDRVVLLGSPGRPEAVRIAIRNDGDRSTQDTAVMIEFSEAGADVRDDTCSVENDQNRPSFLCPWAKIRAHGLVSRDIPLVINAGDPSVHEIAVGIMSADATVSGTISDRWRILAIDAPSSYEASGPPGR